MGVRSGIIAALLSAGLGMLACVTAAAEVPADRAELFAYLVRNPGDVQATLRYADLSTRAGDTEAAIGALERILFYRPDEPNTRLYLGMLYSRLGSYDMARGYFESVAEHPSTPEAIRDRAIYLMNQADKRTEASQWTGFVRTGLRWQSNANYQPDESAVYFGFDPGLPGPSGYFLETPAPQDDWNAYAQGGVFYSYDFGNQRGDRFEAGVTTYNTRQFDFEDYNFNQAEAIVGVRFGVPTGNPTALASIKPYLIAGGAALDDEALYWNAGGGVQAALPVGSFTLTLFGQAIYREFDEAASNGPPADADLSGETGWIYSAGLRVGSDPKAASRFGLSLTYERHEIDDPATFNTTGFVVPGFAFCGPCGPFSETFQNYDRFNAELRLPFDLYWKGHHILTTPLVGLRYTRYDSADPYTFNTVTAGTPDFLIREDLQFRAGISVDYAFTDLAGIGASLLYSTTDSNLAAYDIDNLTISFGPHIRF